MSESRDGGGKGGGSGTTTRTYTYFANFAVALCEGEVAHLGRVWADGELLETSELTCAFIAAPRPAARQPDRGQAGRRQCPAYRGPSYIVFERLPLDRLRQPHPGALVRGDPPGRRRPEPAIRAVTLIPGATEFGYDPNRAASISPGNRRR